LPSGRAGDRCCPAGARVAPAGRALRLPVASVPDGPHDNNGASVDPLSCAVGEASRLSGVQDTPSKLATTGATGVTNQQAAEDNTGHCRPASLPRIRQTNTGCRSPHRTYRNTALAVSQGSCLASELRPGAYSCRDVSGIGCAAAFGFIEGGDGLGLLRAFLPFLGQIKAPRPPNHSWFAGYVPCSRHPRGEL
jgi:hypothetical protein